MTVILGIRVSQQLKKSKKTAPAQYRHKSYQRPELTSFPPLKIGSPNRRSFTQTNQEQYNLGNNC
jgi:hypothetical protein